MAQMNLSTKQKQTHGYREQTCGCQGRGMDWEFGISRCKLLYICVMESLCCMPETKTHCKSTILQ